MNDFKDSAMIALLPTQDDWCQIELPHLTLVYAGETTKLGQGTFSELAKAASTLAALSKPVLLHVVGIEIFGEEDKVEVLRFRPTPELLAMRSVVESWNASKYPFRPHSTIGPIGSSIQRDQPTRLMFDRVYVGWGKESLVFSINRH